MSKFIKKPVAIQAIQWDGQNTREVLIFMGQSVTTKTAVASEKFDDYCRAVKDVGLTIYTLEDGDDSRAKHVASVGDFIIKGIEGEFYPCKPDIFKKTYYTEAEYAEITG
jgi:hypothetical protein